jgi:DNA-binding SARP family transcriptional activator
VRAIRLARLDRLLERVWSHRLTLIVAPAGSGKSTLLASFAHGAQLPVAWYRAESWDREPIRLLAQLRHAFAAATSVVEGSWSSPEDAARAIRESAPFPCLLVVDDLHLLESTAAETALERLLDLLPADLTVMCASRVRPRMNLSRKRVSGELLEIGADDLRFRAWEVERLYRDFYHERFAPEELAVLARRTEGWPAGLQLFHLATAGKATAERRKLLDGFGPGSRLMSEYLSRNVLFDLPANLRSFLIDSSVLGRLTGPLCDKLLDRTNSIDVLTELETRSLFTFPLSEAGEFRYHEVFRSYLQGVLLEQRGETATQRLYQRAGELLAASHALPEALDAYCRAGAWDRVASLLGRDGVSLTERRAAWMDAIPPAMLRHDPWLMLARARTIRAQGRLRDAIDAYADAEAAFGASDGAGTARSERMMIAPWLDTGEPVRSDPASLLRTATIHDPAGVVRRLKGQPEGGARLVAGLSMMLAGDPAAAAESLLSLANDDAPVGLASVLASMGSGVAAILAADPIGATQIRQAIAGAEHEGLDWLERLGHAIQSIVDRNIDDALSVAEAAERAGDTWGAGLTRLLVGWTAGLGSVGVAECLNAAAEAFRRLGAPVLETWARALLALVFALGGDARGEEMALAADSLARSAGVQPARGWAQLALSRARAGPGVLDIDALPLDGPPTPEWVVRHLMDAQPPAQPASHPFEVHTFGSLGFSIDGVQIDLSGARPRVRSLLAMLAVQAGSSVHREILQEALWPGADPDSAAQNLHVAVAAARRTLEPGVTRGNHQLIVREGSSYRLALPPGSWVDLIEFDRLIAAARQARASQDLERHEDASREALELYRDDLLQDEGPADWVIGARERRRQEAVEAAEAAATTLERRGELQLAAQFCAIGLRLDRYYDPLWRRLVAIRERAGDDGAARRVRDAYQAALRELELSA